VSEQNARTLRALVLLTLTAARRLLREGMVLRSLVFPGLIVLGTLTVTVTLIAVLQPARWIAVTAETPPAIIAALEAADLQVATTDSPRAAVQSNGYSTATDGRTVWMSLSSATGLEVEEIVRTQADAPWIPRPTHRRPNVTSGEQNGRTISRVLGLLFVMYGTVFGLGGVARDRDDGTLEAELALPIPRWVGGLARWIASTAILSLFYGLCVLMIAAVVGVAEAGATARHGAAACGGGVAVGLAVAGTAGLKQGFSGPFATAVTGVSALAALGGATGTGWLPIASLFGGGSGWASVGMAILFGSGAAALYGARTGRS